MNIFLSSNFSDLFDGMVEDYYESSDNFVSKHRFWMEFICCILKGNLFGWHILILTFICRIDFEFLRPSETSQILLPLFFGTRKTFLHKKTTNNANAWSIMQSRESEKTNTTYTQARFAKKRYWKEKEKKCIWKIKTTAAKQSKPENQKKHRTWRKALQENWTMGGGWGTVNIRFWLGLQGWIQKGPNIKARSPNVCNLWKW